MKITFIRLILLFFVPLVSQATVVKQMFEVSLPVINQQKDIRQAAFEQAFSEVLVRVSGNSMAATELDIRQAHRYVRQYRYLALENVVEQPAVKADEAVPQPSHTLWIQFDEGSIHKLLNESNLPIWGQQRPSVLLWLAVRDGRHRYILKQNDVSAIKEAVMVETRRRGLPVIWPAMDAKDTGIVSFADIWGNFWSPVQKASERYGVDAIMLGQMTWLNGSWQVNWSLMMNQQSQNWTLQAVDLNVLMASGVDVATDQISSRFAVRENTDTAGNLIVQVNGISQLGHYARVEQYLSSIALAKDVYAEKVENDGVQFHMSINGNADDLKRTIALGRMLVPEQQKPQAITTDSKTALAQQNVLIYKLIR
ncbi:MAG: DUF2066 domain-containing protein [Gammaproteobacteria bacterium]|nr:DUF2066 domain-containing protein [Gammaproteobacteria bacterium]